MRSSDTPESERAPHWEEEEGSDDQMDQDTLVKVRGSKEHLFDQDTDGEEPASRRSS